MDGAERRPDRSLAESLLERGERRRENQLDRLEAPALVDRPRRCVRREHVQLDHFEAALACDPCGLPDERARDAGAPSTRADVHDVELGPARTGRADDGDAVLLRKQDAAVRHLTFDVLEVVVLVRIPPRRIEDLRVELVPERADERQVVLGGDADHGTRCERRR